MRLKDKVAVVTGAGTEFGKSIAVGYLREGAQLYLHEFAENGEKLDKVAHAARQSGGRVETGLFDITTADATAAMTREIVAKFGRIDVLVNTTDGGWHGKFFECTEANWDKALDRGLKAYFLTCQHIGKEMARRGQGKIINITSIVGLLGSGGAVRSEERRVGKECRL